MIRSNVLRPRMSEKTYALSSNGVYVFDVDTKLNKHVIAELVEKTYNVEVVNVRTTTIKGKNKRTFRKRMVSTGQRSDTKKAYVSLKKGDAIPIFAAVEEDKEKADKLAKVVDKKAKKAEKKSKKVAKENK